MCVNYYARMRFIHKLLPQLIQASNSNSLSRVITVLAAGSEADIDMSDLDLKRKFTLQACLAHCVMMTDFMIEELAIRNPGTSFSHSYPGTVKSGIVNSLTGPVRLGVKLLYSVMTPWIMNVNESGQRHLFQITSDVYPSKNGAAGIPRPPDMDVVEGIDRQKGSGAYLLDYDGKAIGDHEFLTKYRGLKAGPLIWEHTMEILRKAGSGKREADGELDVEADKKKDGARRFRFDPQLPDGDRPPDPVGWRPA